MHKHSLAPICAAAFASTLLHVSGAVAQNADKFSRLLNESSLCESIGLRKDINTPLGPVVIAIDKNHHTIKKFERAGNNLKIEGEAACQPGDGGIMAQLGISPATFRLSDNFGCDATLSGSSVTGIRCEVSGEIGKQIAAGINFNNYVKAALEGAM